MSMGTPAKYPIKILIGDTETINLNFENAAGSPINITGRTYTGQIRSSRESSVVIATFTCSIVGAASNGQVACTIPAATTANLEPQVGVYDIQETNGAVVTTLLQGEVKIIRDVTR